MQLRQRLREGNRKQAARFRDFKPVADVAALNLAHHDEGLAQHGVAGLQQIGRGHRQTGFMNQLDQIEFIHDGRAGDAMGHVDAQYHGIGQRFHVAQFHHHGALRAASENQFQVSDFQRGVSREFLTQIFLQRFRLRGVERFSR